jgi:hypothetical protein
MPPMEWPETTAAVAELELVPVTGKRAAKPVARASAAGGGGGGASFDGAIAALADTETEGTNRTLPAAPASPAAALAPLKVLLRHVDDVAAPMKTAEPGTPLAISLDKVFVNLCARLEVLSAGGGV